MGSGPYKVNGVPLRRVNARYVIATSTKLNIGSPDLKKFNDAYFTETKKKNAGVELGDKKEAVPAARKADQKAVDAAIEKAIGKDAVLKKYLRSKFAVQRSERSRNYLLIFYWNKQ